jgi:hypothetical protein
LCTLCTLLLARSDVQAYGKCDKKSGDSKYQSIAPVKVGGGNESTICDRMRTVARQERFKSGQVLGTFQDLQNKAKSKKDEVSAACGLFCMARGVHDTLSLCVVTPPAGLPSVHPFEHSIRNSAN